MRSTPIYGDGGSDENGYPPSLNATAPKHRPNPQYGTPRGQPVSGGEPHRGPVVVYRIQGFVGIVP